MTDVVSVMGTSDVRITTPKFVSTRSKTGMKMKGAIWRSFALYVAATMILCAIGTSAQENLVRDGPLYATEYYTPMDVAPYSPYYQTSQEDRMFRDASDDYPRNDESSYQQYAMEYPERFGNRALDRVMLEFLEDNNAPPKDEATDGIKKRMLSSFRERMEREKSKEQQDKMADMFLQKLQQDVVDDAEAEADVDDSFHREADRERNYMENRDYMEMIQELWEKYKGAHHNRESSVLAYPTPSVYVAAKRQLPADYSTLGWSGVGFRKRANLNSVDEPEASNQNDGLYFLNYQPMRKEFPTNDNSRVRSRYRWLKPTDFDNHLQGVYNPDYLYAQSKRFPVAKRSSNFYSSNGGFVHHKRAANGREQTYKKAIMRNNSTSGTDPKVVKDLSNLFGNKGLNMEKVPTSIPIKTKKVLEKNSKKINKKNVTHAEGHTTTERGTTEAVKPKHQAEEVSLSQANDEPLKIRKKSIDWSNYFGIDRRKKSESYGSKDDVNNDWMIKRYNQAVAMAVKRSSGSEYPLNFFRDNYVSEAGGTYGNEIAQSKRKSQFRNSDASNLDEMDDKLKNIEDLIIDEALKYTGAHEGETDPKEIQEVKDKVISRLAAAYSLEKMRRALSEFKTSLVVQRHAKENGNGDGETLEMNDKDTTLDKSKRPDVESKTTSKQFDIVGVTECDTLIERRCRSGVAGELSSVFFPLCKWHQMCYLCSSNNNPESLTNCDVMFLSKAEAVCHGDVVCQWTARPVVEYLRNVHDTTPTELGTRCQGIVCADEANSDIDPDSDANKIHRR